MAFLWLIRRLLGVTACVLLVGGLIWWLRDVPEAPPPETPVVSFADQPAKAPLRILVTTDKAFTCSKGMCGSAGQPPSEDAVTDGEWWYFYENEEVRSKNQETSKTYLRRKNSASNEVETIMESTPLTSPRDLFISPDGQHVAFWLDNIDNPEEELTELWVYDVDDGGIRLLAEKLYRPDVRSSVHWNSQSTYMWFVADTGEQNDREDMLALILVNADSPGKRAAFAEVPWDNLVGNLSAAAIDLSQQADQLAFTTTTFLGKPVLQIQRGEDSQRTSIQGQLKYTQWLEDGSLLYALQDDRGFTFWRVREGVHRFIARRDGDLTSARSDITGHYSAFTSQSSQTLQLFSLLIESGAVIDEGRLPRSSNRAVIRYVEQLPLETSAPVPEVTTTLDDDELAAFIEKNFTTIVDSQSSTPLRLIMTDEENSLFLDYREVGGAEHRLLIKVHDAVNTEWSIRGRYKPVNREWQKVQGGGLADPAPTRLYEWEEGLNQWILKEKLETGN